MTGLIFVAIAIGWVAFLVPWLLGHRSEVVPTVDEDVSDRFTRSARLIRRGSDPFVEHNDPELQVVTPLQRAAIRRECQRAARIAARRRRIGLLGNLVLVLVGVAIVLLLPVPWWFALVPAGLLLVFLVLSRVSVITVRNMLNAKMALASHGWDENTMLIAADQTATEDSERQVEISVPMPQLESLLEPIPVAAPTYLSKPLVPRSVRTIDLSAPVPPPSQPKLPVIGEIPDDGSAGEDRPDAENLADATRDGDTDEATRQVVRQGEDISDLPSAVGE